MSLLTFQLNYMFLHSRQNESTIWLKYIKTNEFMLFNHQRSYPFQIRRPYLNSWLYSFTWYFCFTAPALYLSRGINEAHHPVPPQDFLFILEVVNNKFTYFMRIIFQLKSSIGGIDNIHNKTCLIITGSIWHNGPLGCWHDYKIINECLLLLINL